MAYDPKRFEQKIIGIDYDGTLNNREFEGEPNVPVENRQFIEKLREAGYTVLVHTCRQSLDAQDIRDKTGVVDIHTGKPVADLYLDDKGLLPRDWDLTEAFIEHHFNTQRDYLNKLVGGELKSAYATNIANVPENPEHKASTDNNFRVYVPVTGGMDSLTLWQMGIESGYPLHPIYIDAGQEYAELEIKTAKEIVEADGYELEVLTMELPFKKYQHILLGRNAVILYMLAGIMRTRGQWGEIWLGNLAGESPTTGGDKSRRFLNDTQALLSLKGYDVRIETPLIGIDKPDEVAYWKYRDIEKLKNTKSCFAVESKACGECQTCFRKWVAFMAHGMDIRDTFGANIEQTFQPYVDKYERVMGEADRDKDYSHYSPSRITTTLGAIAVLKGTA